MGHGGLRQDAIPLPNAVATLYSSWTAFATLALGNGLDKAWARKCNHEDGTYLAILCTHQAEAQVVVLVPGVVVVPVGRTRVLRVVIPATTSDDAVGA